MVEFFPAQRPRRPEITDNMGRKRTLSTGSAAFEALRLFPAMPSQAVLFLGLGPEPGLLPSLLPEILTRCGILAESPACFFVESPEFENGMAASDEYTSGLRHCPWNRLEPGDILRFVEESRPHIIRFIQAPRLFPEFWGPLLAKLEGRAIMETAATGPSGARPLVLAPGSAGELMHREIGEALTELGYTPLALPAPPAEASGRPCKTLTPGLALEQLRAQLKKQKPEFMLSINLRGLDGGGEAFYLLQAVGVPVAIWFVDNPWLILSTLRQPWWKEAFLFVTDASFIPALEEHGAKYVFHLPLACSRFFTPTPLPGQAESTVRLPQETRLLFVGRSSFPERDKYFAAVPKGGVLPEQADALIAEGEGFPDFSWWLRHSLTTRLWPGNEVRFAGWGAEYSNINLKRRWLTAAAPHNLTVVGDEGWKPLLPAGTPLLGQVDYYRDLPALYRKAPFTLNITSMLLPAGLTQRHFDVWTAGGFLLTNRNRGLDIFPAELTDPIALEHGESIAPLMDALQHKPQEVAALKKAWVEHLSEYHTYKERLEFIRDRLN